MHPELNVLTAFLAGIVSFVSPCVLPLVPSYLSFLTGTSLEDLQAEDAPKARLAVMLHAVTFGAGFTVVFIALGLSVSTLGSVLAADKIWIARVGGAVVVLLGLHMMGVFRIPLLMRDSRKHVVHHKPSFLASFVVGVGFAAGWSPCIGPILSAILVKAADEKLLEAGFLLFIYSLGLAVPFLIAAAAITRTLELFNRIKRYLPVIEATSGAVLVATGVVIATGSFTRIAGFFYQYVKPPSL